MWFEGKCSLVLCTPQNQPRAAADRQLIGGMDTEQRQRATLLKTSPIYTVFYIALYSLGRQVYPHKTRLPQTRHMGYQF